jgi:peptidoglycan/xylan/chitin deacetylase (PgdA/CDA1 family)
LTPLVLCYHAVVEGEPQRLAVRRSVLERQLRSLLLRGWTSVGAAEAVAGRGRVFHVTFDDAYRSVNDVLPLLDGLGVRSTIFPATAFARDGRAFDVPELRDDARANPDAFATMDWDALRAACAAGVEIGSHTVSHPHLPQLPDDELARELRDSKAHLEAEVGRPCRFLAYPYGHHDERVRRAARRAGYEAAFAVGGRAADPFCFPRLAVYRHDTWVGFRFRTSVLGRRASARRG